MKNLSKWLFMFVGGVVFAAAASSCTPKDSTDPADGRSGMGLRVDNMTGCHYLTTASLVGETSITPRLRADGTQICTGGKN